MFQSLNSGGITYKLEIQKITFFGLFNKIIEMNYTIPEHHSIKEYKDHWDILIKKKGSIDPKELNING